MTIEQKKHKANLKLVGANKFCEIFNASYYFFMGALFSLLFSENRFGIISAIFLCIGIISRIVYYIFKSVLKEALKELDEIEKVKSWTFSNN